eukprot:366055-Chlamydomonas_euryale.AAC.11
MHATHATPTPCHSPLRQPLVRLPALPRASHIGTIRHSVRAVLARACMRRPKQAAKRGGSRRCPAVPRCVGHWLGALAACPNCVVADARVAIPPLPAPPSPPSSCMAQRETSAQRDTRCCHPPALWLARRCACPRLWAFVAGALFFSPLSNGMASPEDKTRRLQQPRGLTPLVATAQKTKFAGDQLPRNIAGCNSPEKLAGCNSPGD